MVESKFQEMENKYQEMLEEWKQELLWTSGLALIDMKEAIEAEIARRESGS